MAETNFLIPDGNNGNIPVGALPYLNGGATTTPTTPATNA